MDADLSNPWLIRNWVGAGVRFVGLHFIWAVIGDVYSRDFTSSHAFVKTHDAANENEILLQLSINAWLLCVRVYGVGQCPIDRYTPYSPPTSISSSWLYLIESPSPCHSTIPPQSFCRQAWGRRIHDITRKRLRACTDELHEVCCFQSCASMCLLIFLDIYFLIKITDQTELVEMNIDATAYSAAFRIMKFYPSFSNSWQNEFAGAYRKTLLTASGTQTFLSLAYWINFYTDGKCTLSAYHYSLAMNIDFIIIFSFVASTLTIRNYYKSSLAATLRFSCIITVINLVGLVLDQQRRQSESSELWLSLRRNISVVFSNSIMFFESRFPCPRRSQSEYTYQRSNWQS